MLNVATEFKISDRLSPSVSMLDNTTPLIITFDEAPNLQNTLRCLGWAKTIVVIDSYSSDDTLKILERFPHVRVYQRKFDTFAGQCNFGLHLIPTEWVLSLDADYLLTPELVDELSALSGESEVDGYTVRFRYCVFGRQLKGTLYPPRTVLYRRDKAIYEDDGHAHHVRIAGATSFLNSFIHHDDRKSLRRWTSSQSRYVLREVQKLCQADPSSLGLSDRIRSIRILAPFLVMFYCLFVQRVCLDGWAGLYYTYQRGIAETLLAIELMVSSRTKANNALAIDIAKLDSDAERTSMRLTSSRSGQLSMLDRIRKTKVISPCAAPVVLLFGRMEILRGWGGWARAFTQMLFESLLAIHLIEIENLGVGVGVNEV